MKNGIIFHDIVIHHACDLSEKWNAHSKFEALSHSGGFCSIKINNIVPKNNHCFMMKEREKRCKTELFLEIALFYL